jgi:anaerobic C4-dicarboxylate transporter
MDSIAMVPGQHLVLTSRSLVTAIDFDMSNTVNIGDHLFDQSFIIPDAG